MDGWRREATCILAALLCLSGACVSSSKNAAEVRFSEDLQTDGFSIALLDENGEPSQEIPNIIVTDADSIDRLLQWFHHRPKGTPESEVVGTMMLQMLTLPGMQIPTLSIRTPRCRIHFDVFLVVLETRSSTEATWTRVSWALREEDNELRNWVTSLMKGEYKRSLQERGLLPADEDLPIDPENAIELTPEPAQS
ncbi:MAG: hypothetical protein JWP89_3626 [Schlesneria sp.]|nr:hypothetical protein [Schlesneria sp.]